MTRATLGRQRMPRILIALLTVFALTAPAIAATLEVGPGQRYALPIRRDPRRA